MQHKDQFGNAISAFYKLLLLVLKLTITDEPDLSNPTRPRFERPLDTIRSFEVAIYGQSSSRPMSYAQTGKCPVLKSAFGR